MAFGNVPQDAGNIPIAETYVPNTGFVALQGSTLTNTDASSNKSAPGNFNLTQINSLATQMAGTDGMTATNVLVIVPGISNGAGSIDQWREVNGQGDNSSFGTGAVGPYLHNGSTWDKQRANLDNIAILTSAARTTTQTSGDMTNYNHRGIVVVLDMTVVGTGSVTLEIDAKDPISGKYYAAITGAAVTTNSTNVYRVYPGLTAVANATANDVLPRTWRVKVTANNANTATYSVGAMLIL